jgi:hypothetical protein
MKRILLSLFITSGIVVNLLAEAGYTTADAAKINLQTTNGVDNYLSASTFNGTNQGTKSASSYFHIKAAEAWIFKNNSSDVTGGNFHYRIYKQGSTTPSFTSISFLYQEENTNSGTTYQRWGYYTIDIDIMASVNSSGTWVFECYWSSPTNGVNCSNPIYLSNGGSNYSFTFTADATLPVEFLGFSAKPSPTGTILTWTTASERNNSHFEIERTNATRDWQVIGKVRGNGTSRVSNSYTFSDTRPMAGANYYRLKQVDMDGKFSYSRVVAVRFRANLTGLDVTPTVVGDVIRVNLSADDISYSAAIYDITGKVWWRGNLQGTELNVGNLPSGTYMLRLLNEQENQVLQSRFIKL